MFARGCSYFGENTAPYAIFVLALLAHLIVFYAMLYIYGPCTFFLSTDCSTNNNDTQHYSILAYNLTHGHGYSRFIDPPYEPDAFRTPLFVWYLAPFAYFGGLSLIWLAILVLNIVLSIAPIILYKLSREFLSHGYSLAAGLFLAFEPLYLYRSQIAEPDGILVLFMVLSAYLIVLFWRRKEAKHFYSVSVLLGLSVLAKPTAQFIALIFFVFCILFIVFFVDKKAWARELKRLSLGVLIACAVVSPWLIRNYATFGVVSLASIGGFAVYDFYTKDLALPGEQVPQSIQDSSREPSRYLPNQHYFIGVAKKRIQAHLFQYLKEQFVGNMRSLFVSDIAQIYYLGHAKILPFSYDPESRINIHSLLLQGDFVAAVKALLVSLPKVLWICLLAFFYLLAIAGWIYAWKKERLAFLVFSMFLCFYAYLIVASGPFVDAKYRLPALPLVAIVALYGISGFAERYTLRIPLK